MDNGYSIIANTGTETYSGTEIGVGRSMDDFMKHNARRIPVPAFTKKHPLQVMVVLEDGEPMPYSGVYMTNDDMGAVSQLLRTYREATGRTAYEKLWVAVRDKSLKWQCADLTHIAFLV